MNDTIDKLLYGAAYKEVQNIKKISDLGFNIYYDICKTDNGSEYINYNLDFAKRKMEEYIIYDFDRQLFNLLCTRDYHIKAMLRMYDYYSTAINENAKTTVIMLAFIAEVFDKFWSEDTKISNTSQNIKKYLDSFTCGFKQSLRTGACYEYEEYVSFTDLVHYLNRLFELTENNNFNEACMDYIMNLVLKYKI